MLQVSQDLHSGEEWETMAWEFYKPIILFSCNLNYRILLFSRIFNL